MTCVIWSAASRAARHVGRGIGAMDLVRWYLQRRRSEAFSALVFLFLFRPDLLPVNLGGERQVFARAIQPVSENLPAVAADVGMSVTFDEAHIREFDRLTVSLWGCLAHANVAKLGV